MENGMLRHSVLMFGIMMLLPGATLAQAILNPSFESPVLGEGNSNGVNTPFLIGSNSNTVGNWVLTASTLVDLPVLVQGRVDIRDPIGAGPVGISGNQLARLRANGIIGGITSGTVYQDVGVSFTNNTRYTLQADMGVENLAEVLTSFGMRIKAGTTTVAEYDHTTLLALFTNSNQLYPFAINFTVYNESPPTGNLGVEFFQTSAVGVAGSFLVDNVSLTVAAVPEPTTIGLICLSIVGMGCGYSRFRRQQQNYLEETVEA
jgi:hypothetical protein